MDGQILSQNSKRKVEIDHEVIKPYLSRLDSLLKKTASEIEDYGGVKGMNRLFAAVDVNDFKGFGTVEGDAFLGSNDKEPSIISCYLREDPLKNTIRCHNRQTNRLFEIPNSRYLQDIKETVRSLLSIIYWKIHEDHEKELLKRGVPLNVLKEEEPIKLSKLYAIINDINSGQKFYYDPKIQIYLSQDGIWLIKYNNGGSDINLFFKYCDFKFR